MKIGCNTLIFASFHIDTAFEYIAWAGYEGVALHFDPYALIKDATYSAPYIDPARARIQQSLLCFSETTGLSLKARRSHRA